MDLLAAALIHGGGRGVTVLALNGDGEVADTLTGSTLGEALDTLPERPHRVVVADEARVPRAAAVGVIDMISLESAVRAAALSGLAVVASIAVNDELEPEERIEALTASAPELILLAGGTDDGDTDHLEELAWIVASARERVAASTGRVPIVLYAGNPGAQDRCREVLGAELETTDNVRPACEREALSAAVVRLAVLAAGPSAGEEAAAAVPAGAARAFAVRDLAELERRGVVVVHESGDAVEIISRLGPGWNRIVAGDFEAAVALHREWARELDGVPIVREIADAFAAHVRGRDLLEVEPPGLLVGTGPSWNDAATRDSVRILVDRLRPRGVIRIARADAAALTLLGLCALDGWSPSAPAYDRVLETVAHVVSFDGPADALEIDTPWGVTSVQSGTVQWVDLGQPCEIRIVPLARGDLGRGRGRGIDLEVKDPGLGLLVDARGTPVPPRRRRRALKV